MIAEWVDDSCSNGMCPPSTSAALIPLGLGLLFLAAALVCWRLSIRARRANTSRPSLLAAALGGVAVLAFCLLLSTFRHFGGQHEIGDGGSGYACDAWWYQIGTRHGATDGDDEPSPYCRHAAVSAIAPAVAESAAVGLLAGGALFGLFTVRRWRFNERLAELGSK